jgi:uncharacterized protein YchJ
LSVKYIFTAFFTNLFNNIPKTRIGHAVPSNRNHVRIRKELFMATEAQISANRANAQFSTGPRTTEGKARTSQNAVSSGLFSKRDLVRPEEAAVYTEIRDTLWADLHPATLMEKIQAAEIVTAAWRLHRCAALEEALDSAVDPEKVQKSIDRARIQAHGLQLRATAELRRLRKDNAVVPTVEAPTTKQTQSPATPTAPEVEELCVAPADIPRGAPCPCGSGQKYKRCCGRDAPGVINRAA